MVLRLNQQIERRIVRRVIKDALAAGYAISVSDGEDIVLSKSTDYSLIDSKLYSTDEDVLGLFRRNDDAFEQVGWVRFIYGNGPDVLSDYSDNEPTQAIVKGASELANRYA